MFFYCRHADAQRNTFVAIARGFLAQLLRQNDDLLPYLFEKCCQSGEAVLESGILSRHLLECALQTCEQVYIVIDGLDECDRNEKRAILSFFLAISDKGLPSFFKCLFVSRDDGYIGKFLHKFPTIRISAADNREDIQNYVNIWARKIQNKFGLADTESEAIFSAVVSNANGESLSSQSQKISLIWTGMFLYAKLMMQNLYAQTTLLELRNNLKPNTLPPGLEEKYVIGIRSQGTFWTNTLIDMLELPRNCYCRKTRPDCSACSLPPNAL